MAPTIEEPVNVLSADWNRNRVTLFHFAGHADPEYVYFGSQPIEARRLAELLRLQVSLRMLFINGCLSRGHANHYLQLPAIQPLAHAERIQNFQEKLSVVVTGSEVDDIKARTIARDFYSKLRIENHRVITAMDEVNRIAGLFQAEPDSTGEFEWLVLGDKNFRLVDGVCGMLEFVEQRPPLLPIRVVFMLVVALMLAAGTFAFLSHVSKSSPAFQSSFSYGFTDDFFRQHPAPHSVDSSTGLALEDSLKDLQGIGPYFGFLVESGRTAMLLLILFVVAGFIYNYHIPTISPRHRSFLLNRYNLLYLALAIAASLFVFVYHTVVAPQNLETTSVWSAHKDLLQASKTIWTGAGDFWVKNNDQNIKALS
jgi:hypothetical protein